MSSPYDLWLRTARQGGKKKDRRLKQRTGGVRGGWQRGRPVKTGIDPRGEGGSSRVPIDSWYAPIVLGKLIKCRDVGLESTFILDPTGKVEHPPFLIDEAVDECIEGTCKGRRQMTQWLASLVDPGIRI